MVNETLIKPSILAAKELFSKQKGNSNFQRIKSINFDL